MILLYAILSLVCIFFSSICSSVSFINFAHGKSSTIWLQGVLKLLLKYSLSIFVIFGLESDQNTDPHGNQHIGPMHPFPIPQCTKSDLWHKHINDWTTSAYFTDLVFLKLEYGWIIISHNFPWCVIISQLRQQSSYSTIALGHGGLITVYKWYFTRRCPVPSGNFQK